MLFSRSFQLDQRPFLPEISKLRCNARNIYLIIMAIIVFISGYFNREDGVLKSMIGFL
jgi:hypothetical protein